MPTNRLPSYLLSPETEEMRELLEDLDDAMVSVLQVWVTEENTTEDVRERAMEALHLLGKSIFQTRVILL